MKVTEVQGAVVGILPLPSNDKPFRLTIQDPHTHEVIWVDITREVADQIVAKLTSGIRVARTFPFDGRS